LEELLALLEEDDEDEREDELTMGPGAEAPGPPAREIDTGREPEGADPVSVEDESVPAEVELPRRVPEAGDIPLEQQDEIPGADGAVEPDAAGDSGTPEFLWDGLTAVVTGRNGTALLRKPGAGDVSPASLAGAKKQPGAAEADAVMESMTSAEGGLEGLYKQAVRATRPAAQAMPAGQAGRTFRAEEPGRAAALTVEELDRAVRRDSRRYDGGMTLF